MILRLFNGKFILVQVGFILAFFIIMLTRVVPLNEPQGFGPIYNVVYQALHGHPLAINISFAVLLIIEGLLLQLIVMYYSLIPRNNYIILLVWLILSFSNPALISINPVFIATIISTWALFRLLSIDELENTLPNLFTAGFLFSFASLVYGNLLWFIVFQIIGLLVLSLFRGRELMVSIIAFALPYIFLLAFGFVFDQEFIFWNQFHFNIGDWSFFQNGTQLLISILLTLLIIALSGFAIAQVMLQLSTKLIQTRKSTSLIFTMLLITIALQFFSGPWWFTHPILVFMPLSILLAIFLSEQKKTFYLDIIILSIIILELCQLYFIHYA